jgi:hypothetical protein
MTGITRRAVELPTAKSNGDTRPQVAESPGRGERADGATEVPDRQLNIRSH